MIKSCLSILLLLTLSAFMVAQPATVVLILFDTDADGQSIPELADIEDRLKSELQTQGYNVEAREKSAWEVERSFREKKDFIDAINGQYSVELDYSTISKEILLELKKWDVQDSEIQVPAKKLKAGRLSNYPSNQQRLALAIEWSRDVDYYIVFNKIKRPVIAIDEFINESGISNERAEALIKFMKDNLQLLYLNEDISRCIKLKEFEIFDDCINMQAHYTLDSNSLSILIEFTDPDGQASSFIHTPPSIPDNNSEYRDFTKRLINIIEWPEKVRCND